jgi:hypothetical protein
MNGYCTLAVLVVLFAVGSRLKQGVNNGLFIPDTYYVLYLPVMVLLN